MQHFIIFCFLVVVKLMLYNEVIHNQTHKQINYLTNEITHYKEYNLNTQSFCNMPDYEANYRIRVYFAAEGQQTFRINQRKKLIAIESQLQYNETILIRIITILWAVFLSTLLLAPHLYKLNNNQQIVNFFITSVLYLLVFLFWDYILSIIIKNLHMISYSSELSQIPFYFLALISSFGAYISYKKNLKNTNGKSFYYYMLLVICILLTIGLFPLLFAYAIATADWSFQL